MVGDGDVLIDGTSWYAPRIKSSYAQYIAVTVVIRPDRRGLYGKAVLFFVYRHERGRGDISQRTAGLP